MRFVAVISAPSDTISGFTINTTDYRHCILRSESIIVLSFNLYSLSICFRPVYIYHSLVSGNRGIGEEPKLKYFR